MRLNGQSKEKLRAISNFKDEGARIRQPAGEKAASPSDLEEFKRILKTQLLINLNDTKGAPPLHQASKEDHRDRHLEPPLHSFRSPRCVGRGEGAPRQRGGCLHGGGRRQGPDVVEPEWELQGFQDQSGVGGGQEEEEDARCFVVGC